MINVFKCQLQLFKYYKIINLCLSILFFLFSFTFQLQLQQIMNIFLKFQGQTSLIEPNQLRSLINENQRQGRIISFLLQGKVCDELTDFKNCQIVYAHSKLLGGKGGFGAKLKTEGGKKVRPNQNMFSRDTQGQPVSYSTMTKEYEEYYKKKLEDDQKVSKQLAEFQIVSNTYRQDYASTKLDHSYNAEMVENQKRMRDSMKIGIKKFLQKKKEAAKLGSQFQAGKDYEVVVQQGQKQEDNDQLNQPVKRQRPVTNQDNKQEHEENGEPMKKVKPNEEKAKSDIKVQANPNTKFLSAKQKLKSLFKK